jgi:hypothetical protein
MSGALNRLVEKKSGPLVVKIDELIKEQRETNKLLKKILVVLKSAN